MLDLFLLSFRLSTNNNNLLTDWWTWM